MAKNASKSIIKSPTIVAPARMEISVDQPQEEKDKSLISVSWNSTKTALILKLNLFLGLEAEKVEGTYRYTDSGQIQLPDILVVDGIEYWVNAKSAMAKTKAGKSFRAGRNRISLSVKAPKVEAPKEVNEEEIPF